MAISVRSSISTSTGSTPASSLLVTMPAGVLVNDNLFAAVAVDGGTGASVTPPAGWVSLTAADQSTSVKLRVYWRIANGQEAANYTWSFDTARQASIAIVAFAGASNFQPTTFLTGTGSATTSLSPAGINSSYTGRSVVFFGTSNATAATTTTTSGGYTKHEETSTTANAFIHVAVQSVAKPFPMSGVSTAVSTASQSVSYVAVTVCLDDLHLAPFTTFVDIDNYQVGSFTSSRTLSSTSPFATNYPNELVLAFVSVNKDVQTISSITNTAGWTWVNVGRSNTQNGSSEVWRALAPVPVSNQTVTINYSGSVVSGNTAIAGFVGVALNGTNGSGAIGAVQAANGTSGGPSASLTTTRDNSLVVGMYNYPASSTSAVAGTNQTIIRNSADSTNTCLTGVNIQNAVTATSGTSVTINSTTTATAWNALAVEVLPNTQRNLGTSGVG